MVQEKVSLEEVERANRNYFFQFCYKGEEKNRAMVEGKFYIMYILSQLKTCLFLTVIKYT